MKLKILLAVIILFSTVIFSQTEFTSIDTTFYSNGAKLAGTLTLPKIKEKMPAVILLTGSGSQTRDEMIYGFPIFKRIAEYLSSNGIAVFRFDDRGTGGSEVGDFGGTTADYAEDALAAFDFLQTLKIVDNNMIGFLGHSEGGMASIIAGASSPDIAFIILMAGPTIPGSEITLKQISNLLTRKGVSEKIKNEKLKLEKEIIEFVKDQGDPDTLYPKLFNEAVKNYTELPEATKKQITTDSAYAKIFATQTIKTLNNPWIKFWFTYNPKDDLTELSMPILGLYGGKDMQVPAKADSVALRNAAIESGNNKVKIVIFPDANHLFQNAKTGMPEEYPELPKQFVPNFLDSIVKWIKSINTLN